jgi:hypothetical protein
MEDFLPTSLKCLPTRSPGKSMINRIRKSFAMAGACQHGGLVQEAASILGAEPLDFSANINPLGSPPLKELFLEELEHIGHYPDNSYCNFRRAAAKFVNVDMECIVPGNGSSELIRLFAECCFEEGDKALVPTPSFGEYTNQSLLAGATIKRVNIGEDGLPLLAEGDLAAAKLLFLCNPNNPTGRLLFAEQVIDLADRCEETETFLLVDEAFIELSEPEESVATQAPHREFLFVMRSLTKSSGQNSLVHRLARCGRGHIPFGLRGAFGEEPLCHKRGAGLAAIGPAKTGLAAPAKQGQLHSGEYRALRPYLRCPGEEDHGPGRAGARLPVLWPRQKLHPSSSA